ncbi:type IV leader peptidase [Frankia torreyi]|uniref:Type IV leader peptidase n=1 Tax=Frankia torreyi TaxID=1856 RepID=A0A0D8BB41_9ACTN|nr:MULTISPECIES: prepilin peptidase [Frankia]KJE21300.1 type IV leader peptidase [Frankia torreyi]KQC35590.1 peptidase A24 [Frankia sp. ACN1ag]KQM03368.1 type IV leader peptidase [Frankia sp. CpI1-P]
MGEIGLSVLIALVALAVAVPVGHRVVAGVLPPDGDEPRHAAPGTAALGIAAAVVVAAVTAALHRHPGWLPAYLYLSVVGVWLAVADLRVHRLPDLLVLPSYPVLAALLGLAALVDGAPGRLLRVAIAGAACWLAFLALYRLPGAGLGRGDVKLVGLLGGALGWLGWPSVVFGMFAGVVLGGVAALVLLAARRARWHDRLAYGPFLLAGTLLAVLAGGG